MNDFEDKFLNAPSQLSALLYNMAQLGATQAMVSLNAVPPTLTKQQAFKRYGRPKVEAWIREGLITKNRPGEKTSTWAIDIVKADALNMASLRHLYLERTTGPL